MTIKLFLSCVSAEFEKDPKEGGLGKYRSGLMDILNIPGVELKIQKDFTTTGGSLLGKLNDYIKNCDAVVHLIGNLPGSSPEEDGELVNDTIKSMRSDLLANETTPSYTQLEAYFAYRHQKLLFCYMYKFDDKSGPDASQESHIHRLRSVNIDLTTEFTTLKDLRQKIEASLAETIPDIFLKVAPRGLLSFDKDQANDFIKLLPGERKDRLPESLFKLKQDTIGQQNAPTLIVVHGPSGCGKTSLIKAGLMPLLDDLGVHQIYASTTGQDLEARILKQMPIEWRSTDGATLAEAMQTAATASSSKAKRLLIIIDQFEQWLRANPKEEEQKKLLDALSHCNGKSLQAMLLIREDAWTQIDRFIEQCRKRHRDLSAAKHFVDRFELPHARRVLAAFGRNCRCGRPDEAPEVQTLDKDENEFVHRAIEELADESRHVIPVQIAIFVQMIRDKRWSPETLDELGDFQSVGVKFLEEEFSRREFNRFEAAARRVLKTLIREDLSKPTKGDPQHYQQLQAISEWENQTDFEKLLDLLDGKLRLIMPVSEAETLSYQSYQLTHDYLVPAIRAWLVRKQQETIVGRAEILLEELHGIWTSTVNRPLPTWPQWLEIVQTEERYWTDGQKKMMCKATKNILEVLVKEPLTSELKTRLQDRIKANAGRIPMTFSLLTELLEKDFKATHAEEVNAHTSHHSNPNLETIMARTLSTAVKLVWLNGSAICRDYLQERILDVGPHDLELVRNALDPVLPNYLEHLWSEMTEKGRHHAPRRLRAAAALASYASQDPRWEEHKTTAVDELVKQPAVYLGNWLPLFEPVKACIVDAAGRVYRHSLGSETERSLAFAILVEFGKENSAIIADYLMDADPEHFDTIFRQLKAGGEEFVACLDPVKSSLQPVNDTGEYQEGWNITDRLAKRTANSALARFRMGEQESLLSLFAWKPDARIRSYLIHRLAALGINSEEIIRRLDGEQNPSTRFALILSLGEYPKEDLVPELHEPILEKLLGDYRQQTHAGLHAAIGWLARRWDAKEWLKANSLSPSEASLENLLGKWRAQGWLKANLLEKHRSIPSWYKNPWGQALVLIPGTDRFQMGSPRREQDRGEEPQHYKRIPRIFALSMFPVTWREFLEFKPWEEFLRSKLGVQPNDVINYRKKFTEDDFLNSPASYISWKMATEYCDWLSEQEQLQPRYFAGNSGTNDKAGYRLPTETEMEYAIRAGSTTSRFYGETDELLKKYAWYAANAQNRTQPVGHLKPNDWGLFDVLGNCYTWCEDIDASYPANEETTFEDNEEAINISSDDKRVMRGGMYFDQSSDVRSAYRYHHECNDTENFIGFRIARTIQLLE